MSNKILVEKSDGVIEPFDSETILKNIALKKKEEK